MPRNRSRSPQRHTDDRCRRHRSPRSQHRHRHDSSRRHDHHSEKHDHKRRKVDPTKPVNLPFKAPSLSKSDLDSYRPLFASYLDIQKQKDIQKMNHEEIKGRWKSFYHKWNNKELAQGWYDPDMKTKADGEWAFRGEPSPPRQPSRDEAKRDRNVDSDSDTGPKPAPLTFDDLAERNEARAEAVEAERSILRAARNVDRSQQKERLEELAPRAEAGTKERMLEKKREANDAATAYREGRAGGGDMVEFSERDLMGDGGIEEAKALRRREQAKMTEREQRKAEIWAARKAEREERMHGAREKEVKAMEKFKRMAAENFGGDFHVDREEADKVQREKLEESVAKKFGR